MGKFDVYTESELLEVKVPMVFLVAGCFSLPRDGHYKLCLSTLAQILGAYVSEFTVTSGSLSVEKREGEGSSRKFHSRDC